MHDIYDEVCEHCGLTQGAHNGTEYYSEYYRLHVPYNYCPGHQSRMDWGYGPGTCFKPTGRFEKILAGTEAKR